MRMNESQAPPPRFVDTFEKREIKRLWRCSRTTSRATNVPSTADTRFYKPPDLGQMLRRSVESPDVKLAIERR
jgi:hypothetical protein